MTIVDDRDAAAWSLDSLLGPAAARSAEMEAVWTWLVEQDRDEPNWMTLPPNEARALHNRLSLRWNRVLPEVQAVAAFTVPGVPDVACQLIEPPDAVPGCILFVHGGGWSFGNLATYQRLMRLLALATRTRILGVDYRLAPEHPYPAPLADVRTTWRWLVGEAATDTRFAGPLSIAGDSAGANLALALTINAIATGEPGPDAALLFYGAFRHSAESASYRRFAEGFGLTQAAMARFWDFYVPGDVDGSDPLVSPVQAPDAMLAQLPPLYLNAAGLDPLLCDTLDLVDRLRAVDAPHEFRIHDGVHHGFMQMSLRLPEAGRAIDLAALYLHDVTQAAAERRS